MKARNGAKTPPLRDTQDIAWIQEAKMIKARRIFAFLVMVSALLVPASELCAQEYPYKPNLFDRIGLNTEHGLHGAVPEENVDLFTGNVTLRYLDIFLPGPNGLKLSREPNRPSSRSCGRDSTDLRSESSPKKGAGILARRR